MSQQSNDAQTMKQDKVDIAEGQAITIRFHSERCIHSRFCVLQAPKVFLANKPGQWIFPDAMDADKLVAVAENCPSGAIQYERKDGKPNEAPPPVNTIRSRENGPNIVRAEILLKGEPVGNRMALCRCGKSQDKPYCDNSHIDAKFIASGEAPAGDLKDLAARDGKLVLAPQPNGPNHISGNLEICTGTGHPIGRVTDTYLCRCGDSANKPYCDGTHERIGFKAP